MEVQYKGIGRGYNIGGYSGVGGRGGWRYGGALDTVPEICATRDMQGGGGCIGVQGPWVHRVQGVGCGVRGVGCGVRASWGIVTGSERCNHLDRSSVESHADHRRGIGFRQAIGAHEGHTRDTGILNLGSTCV